MSTLVRPPGPGVGEGWDRLVAALPASLSVAEIDRIWVFRTIRYLTRDFGTAILSRAEGDRRRIYTARFALTVKGKSRGRFESTVHEVGSGPTEALDQLLALVPKRSDEEEPPIEIPVTSWFPPSESVAQSG
jgi:hypothetical protein